MPEVYLASFWTLKRQEIRGESRISEREFNCEPQPLVPKNPGVVRAIKMGLKPRFLVF